MKTFSSLCKLFTLALLAVFASCTLTEQVYINEDGSGQYRLGYDGSGMMAMMADMGSSDSTSSTKDMDTTVVFRDLLEMEKDSIAQLSEEDQEALKALEPYTMDFIVSEEDKKMMFDLKRDFRDLGELTNGFRDFQKAMSMGDSLQQSQEANPFSNFGQGSEVTYTFKKNTFTRSASIPTAQDMNISENDMQGMEMMLDATMYKLEYHFPRKIKSTSLDGATLSPDGKTLNFQISLSDVMKSPEALNFEVELERR